MGTIRCGSRRRIKIRRGQEEVVGLGIERHRFGPDLGLDRLDLTVLLGRVFVEDMAVFDGAAQQRYTPGMSRQGDSSPKARIQLARKRQILIF
jgi:hypothetical protein